MRINLPKFNHVVGLQYAVKKYWWDKMHSLPSYQSHSLWGNCPTQRY